MDKQVKALWLEALRSGEYAQTKKRLRRKDSFCCLGVLCDLHQKATGDGAWNKTEYVAFGSGNNLCVPVPVAKWAGLPDGNPDIFIDEDGPVLLAQLNDEGADFALIAAIIETEL